MPIPAPMSEHDKQQTTAAPTKQSPTRTADHPKDNDSSKARERSVAALKLDKRALAARATAATNAATGDAATMFAKQLQQWKVDLTDLKAGLEEARHDDRGAEPVLQHMAAIVQEAKAASLTLGAQIKGADAKLRVALAVQVQQVLHQWQYADRVFEDSVNIVDREGKRFGDTTTGAALRTDLSVLDAEIRGYGAELSSSLKDLTPGSEGPLTVASLEAVETATIDSELAAANAALESMTGGNAADAAKLNLAAAYLAKLPTNNNALKSRTAAIRKLSKDIKSFQSANASLAGDVEVARGQLEKLGSDVAR